MERSCARDVGTPRNRKKLEDVLRLSGDLVGGENCGGRPLHNVRDGVAHWGCRPGDEIESDSCTCSYYHWWPLSTCPSQEEVKGTVRPEGRSVLAPTWVQKTAAKSKKLAYFCAQTDCSN